MTSSARSFIKPAIFLLIICILSAGCTSGKEVQPAPATPVPDTPLPSKYGSKGLTPVPAPQVTVLDDGLKTCSQLKGSIAIPGQVCPGTWLTATDSFSCCSTSPVAGKNTKPRQSVEPLDLRVIHNDTFVQIGSV